MSLIIRTKLYATSSAMLQTHILDDINYYVNISALSGPDATVFCWKRLDPTVKTLWASSNFVVEIGSTEYKVFFGKNTSHLEDQIRRRGNSFWDNQLPWKYNNLRFNPFQDSCYGIFTSEQYGLYLEYTAVNPLLVFIFLASLVMFFLAPFLCRNTLVHYTTWVTFCIFFSFIGITFLLQKRFRQSFFSWVFLAYSLSFFLMSRCLDNLEVILSPNILPWIICYCLVTGLVAGAVLYRIGPPAHSRTLSLIQWFIQGVSLILMSMSSYNTKASIIIAILIFIISILPAKNMHFWQILRKLDRSVVRRQKVAFMTEAELKQCTEVETRLALEQLRRDCKKNHRKAWKILSTLKNPGRFAKFVEGGPAVTDEEAEEHRRFISDESTDSFDCDVSSDIENDSLSEFGHRFTCFVCNPDLRGHRFSCETCSLEN